MWNSRAAPHHCSHPSFRLPLWAGRHYLMSLSFWAAGVGVGVVLVVLRRSCCAEHHQTALIQPHQSVSKCRFSGQIKYLIYNLYIFFSVSLFLWHSLHLCCPLQVGSGTCSLGVHRVIMWLYWSYTQSVKRKTEQSGERGTENEKRGASLWQQWHFLSGPE